MTRRARLRNAALCLGLLGAPEVQGDPAPKSPQTPTTKQELRAAQSYRGCPEVCAQNEACVHHRCVDVCRPDCREGTYCTPSGTCEQLAYSQEPVVTEAEQQSKSGESSKDSRTLLFIDVGGALGYGIRTGLEFGQAHAALIRFQIMNTGVLSHAEYVENEHERFEWGFGFSAGYRKYMSTWGNLRGFYVGGGLDYSVSMIGSRGDADIYQVRHSAAPYGEFGYRWVFGSFALAFGPTLALRYPIFVGSFGSDEDLCEKQFDCRGASRRFEGTVNLEVGWFQ